MAIHNDDVAAVERAAVVGRNGELLGTVAGIYFDNATDHPDWAAVRGPSGGGVALVPLAAAELRGGELHVPFDGAQLAAAPQHDPGRELSTDDEIALFRHYGVSYAAWVDTQPSDAQPSDAQPLDPQRPDAQRTDAQRAEAQPAGLPGSDAMTRSEERLRVRTETQAVGRVRLRKHVVTEYQQVTVPVRREEIRVEHVPAGEADTVADDAGAPAGSAPVGAAPATGVDPDGEREIILYAERPVVQTETVAVERVRVGTHTVTGEEIVGGEVRREEIEVETDPDVRGPR